VGKGWEVVERRHNQHSAPFDVQSYKNCLAYCMERNKPYFDRD